MGNTRYIQIGHSLYIKLVLLTGTVLVVEGLEEIGGGVGSAGVIVAVPVYGCGAVSVKKHQALQTSNIQTV